ncbi:class I SAM-dependent methyltransferase [Saccharibacillus alkalitolerans]|uniref:Methyltransferase domain-containing protein n=1 Tax=Saccharibacillus alkalitolerans TaxID=2705290 RepID=A0ABX0FD53_9BACL|nr:methyltransferase domain-containing protein [Saccharibacillus alkalitolerans]NGZ77564.1 methyltransferase domain-containing protein [Saccharibacillus alkalitolerans]
MFDTTRIPGDASSGPYALPRGEAGFAEAVRPQGTEFADSGTRVLKDKVVRLQARTNRFYFKLRFGGEIQYRWTFLAELDIRRGDRVLETAVGTGANLPLLPAGAHLYGLDRSAPMLREAARHLKEWGTEAELILGTAERLPFRGDSFDCVYRIGGLGDCGDPALALSEMIRVAKSGTKLLIADEVDSLARGRRARISLAKKSDRPRPAVLNLLPAGMLDVNYEEVCKGTMYRLTFRKP